MRTHMITILMSVVALGLIGCGKGFESVNKANKAGADKTMPWPDAEQQKPVIDFDNVDPQDDKAMSQIFRVTDLAPGESSDSVIVMAIVQTGPDSILEVSSGFDNLVDTVSQDSIADKTTGWNLVDKSNYDSTKNLVSFNVTCTESCAVVDVVASKGDLQQKPVQFRLVFKEGFADYVASPDVGYKAKREAVMNEINAKLVEKAEALNETPLSEYEQAVDTRSALDKAKEFGGDLKRSHSEFTGKVVDVHEAAVSGATDAMEWTANKWNEWTKKDD